MPVKTGGVAVNHDEKYVNWFDSFESFIKVAKYGSFTDASHALSLPKSVVTKRIQWLELQLNATLFLRTTRQVTLTDIGIQLLNKIEPLLVGWHEIHAELIDYETNPQGEIVVCLPPNMSSSLFFPFQEFLSLHPKIKLNLITTSVSISLVDEHVDILIAPEKYLLNPEDSIGVKLYNFSQQVYASPDYLKKYGYPKTLSDLQKHNCLIFKDQTYWSFLERRVTVSGNWRADSGDGIIQACLRGLGLAYLPDMMIQEEARSGSLIQVLTDYPTEKQSIQLYYPKHSYKPKKLTIFIDFLIKTLRNRSLS